MIAESDEPSQAIDAAATRWARQLEASSVAKIED